MNDFATTSALNAQTPSKRKSLAQQRVQYTATPGQYQNASFINQATSVELFICAMQQYMSSHIFTTFNLSPHHIMFINSTRAHFDSIHNKLYMNLTSHTVDPSLTHDELQQQQKQQSTTLTLIITISRLLYLCSQLVQESVKLPSFLQFLSTTPFWIAICKKMRRVLLNRNTHLYCPKLSHVTLNTSYAHDMILNNITPATYLGKYTHFDHNESLVNYLSIYAKLQLLYSQRYNTKDLTLIYDQNIIHQDCIGDVTRRDSIHDQNKSLCFGEITQYIIPFYKPIADIIDITSVPSNSFVITATSLSSSDQLRTHQQTILSQQFTDLEVISNVLTQNACNTPQFHNQYRVMDLLKDTLESNPANRTFDQNSVEKTPIPVNWDLQINKSNLYYTDCSVIYPIFAIATLFDIIALEGNMASKQIASLSPFSSFLHKQQECLMHPPQPKSHPFFNLNPHQQQQQPNKPLENITITSSQNAQNDQETAAHYNCITSNLSLPSIKFYNLTNPTLLSPQQFSSFYYYHVEPNLDSNISPDFDDLSASRGRMQSIEGFYLHSGINDFLSIFLTLINSTMIIAGLYTYNQQQQSIAAIMGNSTPITSVSHPGFNINTPQFQISSFSNSTSPMKSQYHTLPVSTDSPSHAMLYQTLSAVMHGQEYTFDAAVSYHTKVLQQPQPTTQSLNTTTKFPGYYGCASYKFYQDCSGVPNGNVFDPILPACPQSDPHLPTDSSINHSNTADKTTNRKCQLRHIPLHVQQFGPPPGQVSHPPLDGIAFTASTALVLHSSEKGFFKKRTSQPTPQDPCFMRFDLSKKLNGSEMGDSESTCHGTPSIMMDDHLSSPSSQFQNINSAMGGLPTGTLHTSITPQFVPPLTQQYTKSLLSNNNLLVPLHQTITYNLIDTNKQVGVQQKTLKSMFSASKKK